MGILSLIIRNFALSISSGVLSPYRFLIAIRQLLPPLRGIRFPVTIGPNHRWPRQNCDFHHKGLQGVFGVRLTPILSLKSLPAKVRLGRWVVLSAYISHISPQARLQSSFCEWSFPVKAATLPFYRTNLSLLMFERPSFPTFSWDHFLKGVSGIGVGVVLPCVMPFGSPEKKNTKTKFSNKKNSQRPS